MSLKTFYLIGDDASAQELAVQPSWKIEDLKRAVGLALHVVQPLGITFHPLADNQTLDTVNDVLSTPLNIGLRINGRAVQSPQGPEGLPLVGSFYEIFPDHLGNHYRLFRKYGSVIKTTNMGKTTYLTDDPEVASIALQESIYFTKNINENHPLYGVKDNTATFIGDTETENWRLAHRFLPPAMGPKAVRHYTPLMQECVRSSFSVFDALDAQGSSFNFALLEVKILLSELVYRYEFTREGLEAVEYDPEFQLIRPLNFYVTAKRRTSWPKAAAR